MGAIARHVAGALGAWLVFTLQGLLGYLALLAYALVTDTDAGGPLAGPLLVLLAAVLGVVVVPLLVVPAVLLGEAIRRRRGRFLGALVGGATAMLLAALVAVSVALVTVSPTATVLVGVIAALAMVAPVAVYPAVAAATRVLSSRLARRLDPVFGGGTTPAP
ncbi:hypothetical protein ACFOOK_04140 [Micromonospora krabiensis]|uniref:Uncharacterized protein n=1 Tax=Micromonospora krabiensis TaxID=307121 RepID=A0A1C3NE51_9ACTN|nr:hypothetical protein [Micromonospora krabiensis]SBV30819.1 hypothetical protein GA0070620_6421 [Micromonospora krabiensis]